MAKKKTELMDWDDPFIALFKMVPEYLVRPKLGVSETYWREWLERKEVPFIPICGVRFFHVDVMGDWYKDHAKILGSGEAED